MKRTLLLSIFIILCINSCRTTNHSSTKSPAKKTKPIVTNTGTSTTSAAQTEGEYQALIKTYKPETTDVLNSLLNGSSNDSEVSISVENKSRCNMVLTISGNNYFKKIPIGVNKMGSAMVPKNQNYNLSGMLCNSVYKKTKFVANSFKMQLSN